MTKPKYEQLPLLSAAVPGMEPSGRPGRAPGRSPGEHELLDAERITDAVARDAAIARIHKRSNDFWAQWDELYRRERCRRCEGGLSKQGGLLYTDKPYCAACRSEIWNVMGKRVGLYP